MKFINVPGKNKTHETKLYALSTCVHCKAVKQFLRDNDVEFEYIDVDLCDKNDQQEIVRDIVKRGGQLSFPKIIVDDVIMITGFDKKRIKESLEN